MPELPEVETCRRMIAAELTGVPLAAVSVNLPKLLRFSPLQPLNLLVGQSIRTVFRSAKVLILNFSEDLSLVMHLKLAGQIAIHRPDGSRLTAGHPVPDPEGPYPHKSTHIEFQFEGGTILYFSDLRQFSWLRLMPSDDVPAFLASLSLGPEPIGPDAITAVELQEKLSRRRIPVKTALLDQSLVAGLGNIYVDEALHRARIHPHQPANSLTMPESETLHAGIQWALQMGIEQGGAKIVHHKAYPVDNFPAVHAREGQACFTCGETIIKTRTGARGTYLCPHCQQLH